jgi:membrane protein
MGAVIALIFALLAQVALSTAQQVVEVRFPWLSNLASILNLSMFLPPVIIYASLFLLFYTLTPSAYRIRRYPKWPGALLVTVWWVAVSSALPNVLHRFFTYDLTYGSLAGVMIALFFFWLVGLGMVVGAELNAALTESPEERDLIGQTDNRAKE